MRREHFECAICKDIIDDPVQASDSHLYDRYCIEENFSFGNINSPFTREAITELKEVSYEVKSGLSELLTPEDRIRKAEIKMGYITSRLPRLQDQYPDQIEKLTKLAEMQVFTFDLSTLLVSHFAKILIFIENVDLIEMACEEVPTTLDKLWQLLEFEDIAWFKEHVDNIKILHSKQITLDNFLLLNHTEPLKYKFLSNKFEELTSLIFDYKFTWTDVENNSIKSLDHIFKYFRQLGSIVVAANISWHDFFSTSDEILQEVYQSWHRVIPLLGNGNLIWDVYINIKNKNVRLLFLENQEIIQRFLTNQLFSINEFLNFDFLDQKWLVENFAKIIPLCKKIKFISFQDLLKHPKRDVILDHYRVLNELMKRTSINMLVFLQQSTEDITYVLNNHLKFIEYYHIGRTIYSKPFQYNTVEKLAEFINNFKRFKEEPEEESMSTLLAKSFATICLHKSMRASAHNQYGNIYCRDPEKQPSFTTDQKILIAAGAGLTILGGGMWLLMVTGVIITGAAFIAIAWPAAIAVTAIGVCTLLGVGIYKCCHKPNDACYERLSPSC